MIRSQKKYVACFGLSDASVAQLLGRQQNHFHFLKFSSLAEFLSVAEFSRNAFRAILFESRGVDDLGLGLKTQLKKVGYGQVPFVVIADELPYSAAKKLLQAGIAEVFKKPASVEIILKKLPLIIEARSSEPAVAAPYAYSMPVAKRAFDIVFASIALLLLSPVFLIVALLIRLESKGPVFYYALRVGTGYRIFKFYKFRSMSADADKKLSQLKHLNQYAAGKTLANVPVKKRCADCERSGAACQAALYADNEMWCEKLYREHLLSKGQQAFVKIKDDPRITRVGKFIRNTSIDELPQLWNVLKGDMSVVGNRPLPLYEAEKLTTDKYALRFMAPAGITGLWQVSKRGKGAMSEDERISLDNTYARSYGLWFDIKLILRTVPALLQKENV